MLLKLWSERPYRATLDLDLLRRGEGSEDAIRADLRAIVATPVPPDAVEFDGERIRIEAIRAEDEDAGTRATLPARCGKARVSLQIDMRLADAVWPAPQPCTFPTLLDLPAPERLAYPREAVVAEKLEAMVSLGVTNSRMKDFYDVQALASRFAFQGPALTRAVRATFLRRGTPFPAGEPLVLTREFLAAPERQTQWRAFLRKGRLDAPPDAGELADSLRQFLGPVLASAAAGERLAASWKPGGPWR